MKAFLDLNQCETVQGNQADQLALEWHGLYCPERLAWVKSKPKSGFRWERMKRDCEGETAYALFKEQLAHDYFIMPEDFGFTSRVIYKTTERPFDYSEAPALDCYIFPKNLAWTFALTHETGWLGPYFAKHEMYSQLQKKNINAYNAKFNNL